MSYPAGAIADGTQRCNPTSTIAIARLKGRNRGRGSSVRGLDDDLLAARFGYAIVGLTVFASAAATLVLVAHPTGKLWCACIYQICWVLSSNKK